MLMLCLGGVAIGGRSDLPEGRAGMMDKIVGKTQKVRESIHHPRRPLTLEIS